VISEGAFVKILFPTAEKPRQPGLSHVCHCLVVRPPVVLVAYTTSVPWPPNAPLPFGVRLVRQEEAAALNQRRAFRLHLNRQARTPLDIRWILNLNAFNKGMIAMAPARLRQELYEMTRELVKRYEQNI
jgi:hypothetical protein